MGVRDDTAPTAGAAVAKADGVRTEAEVRRAEAERVSVRHRSDAKQPHREH